MKCGGFFVATHHEALLGDCTICEDLLHMRVYIYRTREIKSVVYGRNAENELVSRIDFVSMGTL